LITAIPLKLYFNSWYAVITNCKTEAIKASILMVSSIKLLFMQKAGFIARFMETPTREQDADEVSFF
jgi:hypothetical protein